MSFRNLTSQQKNEYESYRSQLRGCQGPWENMSIFEFANYWDNLEKINNDQQTISNKKILKKIQENVPEGLHCVGLEELPATFLIQYGNITSSANTDWRVPCYATLTRGKHGIVSREIIRHVSELMFTEHVECTGYKKGVYMRLKSNNESLNKLTTINCFKILKRKEY